MGNPLPPGLPPGFWEDYRKRIESEIADLKRDLARFELGEMHLLSAGADVTEHWIAHFRRTINNYETILDALKEGSCANAHWHGARTTIHSSDSRMGRELQRENEFFVAVVQAIFSRGFVIFVYSIITIFSSAQTMIKSSLAVGVSALAGTALTFFGACTFVGSFLAETKKSYALLI